MIRTQKKIVIAALALLLLMLLFPPFSRETGFVGYAPFFSDGPGATLTSAPGIDVVRLALQVLAVAAGCVLALLWVSDSPNPG